MERLEARSVLIKAHIITPHFQHDQYRAGGSAPKTLNNIIRYIKRF
jgi:hypothetical protein